MQKLNLRMQKLNFPGTHWRGLAVIDAQKKTLIGYLNHKTGQISQRRTKF